MYSYRWTDGRGEVYERGDTETLAVQGQPTGVMVLWRCQSRHGPIGAGTDEMRALAMGAVDAVLGTIRSEFEDTVFATDYIVSGADVELTCDKNGRLTVRRCSASADAYYREPRDGFTGARVNVRMRARGQGIDVTWLGTTRPECGQNSYRVIQPRRRQRWRTPICSGPGARRWSPGS